MNNIFLQSNNGCFSNDVENKLNVKFSTKVRLLPNEDLTKEFSLSEQYNRERDECERFRLIVTINPICSNVLFNPKTEIIIDEGSENVKVLCDCNGSDSTITKNDKVTNTKNRITYIDAIRNTEYSHPELGDFKYHCGFDIFNNHMLRNKSFVHVNKINDINTDNGESYNTISDYSRDKLGNIIEQRISVDVTKRNDKMQMHLYNFDSLLTMKQAFIERCEEQDGWWGFINPSNINIPNRDDENILTNRLLNDRKACEFIDLYPDRSLYSFIPKYNKFRNRLEKNWDYCITYPYKNDYDMINTVCGGKKSAIRTNFIKKNNTSGVEILECHSYFKHNLNINDIINVYYYDNNGFQLLNRTIKIESIGDGLGNNKEKIFGIKYNDIASIYNDISNKEIGYPLDKWGLLGDVDNNSIYHGCLFFKKKINGNECQYYFRKFKKLKTIEGNNLRSDINKVAFGKNIYGDDISQIIFTDDININGLVDNNNRPLSKVYLTIIKRNAGHDIWYRDWRNGGDNGKTDEKIEYSHCFGKVTSGLDFSGMQEEPLDYNIHKMHNLNFNDTLETYFNLETDTINIVNYEANGSNVIVTIRDNKSSESAITLTNTDSSEIRTFLMWGESVLRLPKTLENVLNNESGVTSGITNDITINDEEFFGDVVEFDNVNYKETIISNVYHRVNTAQRECFDKCFRDLLQDRIEFDDFDVNVVKRRENFDKFTVKTYHLNDVITSDSEWEGHTNIGKKNLIYGNIMPEGNYYNPHTQIDLKSEDLVTENSEAKLINYGTANIDGNILIVDVPTNYGFYKGDYIAFYNSETNDTIWGEIIKTENKGFRLYINIENINESHKYPKYFIGSEKIYKAYWSPNNVPVYAKFLPKNRKFVWKKILGQSELNSNDPLYEMTFANGRLYIEKNINFFLRRQDPFGKYGLSKPITSVIGKQYTNPSDDYSIPGDKQTDFTGIIYSINNFDNCY